MLSHGSGRAPRPAASRGLAAVFHFVLAPRPLPAIAASVLLCRSLEATARTRDVFRVLARFRRRCLGGVCRRFLAIRWRGRALAPAAPRPASGPGPTGDDPYRFRPPGGEAASAATLSGGSRQASSANEAGYPRSDCMGNSIGAAWRPRPRSAAAPGGRERAWSAQL